MHAEFTEGLQFSAFRIEKGLNCQRTLSTAYTTLQQQVAVACMHNKGYNTCFIGLLV